MFYQNLSDIIMHASKGTRNSTDICGVWLYAWIVIPKQNQLSIFCFTRNEINDIRLLNYSYQCTNIFSLQNKNFSFVEVHIIACCLKKAKCSGSLCRLKKCPGQIIRFHFFHS